jgi:hypothetical protein
MTIEEKWEQFWQAKCAEYEKHEVAAAWLYHPVVRHEMRMSFYAGIENAMDYPTYEIEWRKELSDLKGRVITK